MGCRAASITELPRLDRDRASSIEPALNPAPPSAPSAAMEGLATTTGRLAAPITERLPSSPLSKQGAAQNSTGSIVEAAKRATFEEMEGAQVGAGKFTQHLESMMQQMRDEDANNGWRDNASQVPAKGLMSGCLAWGCAAGTRSRSLGLLRQSSALSGPPLSESEEQAILLAATTLEKRAEGEGEGRTEAMLADLTPGMPHLGGKSCQLGGTREAPPFTFRPLLSLLASPHTPYCELAVYLLQKLARNPANSLKIVAAGGLPALIQLQFRKIAKDGHERLTVQAATVICRLMHNAGVATQVMQLLHMCHRDDERCPEEPALEFLNNLVSTKNDQGTAVAAHIIMELAASRDEDVLEWIGEHALPLLNTFLNHEDSTLVPALHALYVISKYKPTVLVESTVMIMKQMQRLLADGDTALRLVCIKLALRMSRTWIKLKGNNFNVASTEFHTLPRLLLEVAMDCPLVLGFAMELVEVLINVTGGSVMDSIGIQRLVDIVESRDTTHEVETCVWRILIALSQRHASKIVNAGQFTRLLTVFMSRKMQIVERCWMLINNIFAKASDVELISSTSIIASMLINKSFYHQFLGTHLLRQAVRRSNDELMKAMRGFASLLMDNFDPELIAGGVAKLVADPDAPRSISKNAEQLAVVMLQNMTETLVEFLRGREGSHQKDLQTLQRFLRENILHKCTVIIRDYQSLTLKAQCCRLVDRLLKLHKRFPNLDQTPGSSSASQIDAEAVLESMLYCLQEALDVLENPLWPSESMALPQVRRNGHAGHSSGANSLECIPTPFAPLSRHSSETVQLMASSGYEREAAEEIVNYVVSAMRTTNDHARSIIQNQVPLGLLVASCQVMPHSRETYLNAAEILRSVATSADNHDGAARVLYHIEGLIKHAPTLQRNSDLLVQELHESLMKTLVAVAEHLQATSVPFDGTETTRGVFSTNTADFLAGAVLSDRFLADTLVRGGGVVETIFGVFDDFQGMSAEQKAALGPHDRHHQMVLLERSARLIQEIHATRTASDIAKNLCMQLAEGRGTQRLTAIRDDERLKEAAPTVKKNLEVAATMLEQYFVERLADYETATFRGSF
ncbi:hypothetical protein CYMTET_10442 [Cymbomonas tetramitiformis]|uniref:Uncharacterized protein n=1 Tax=Cymbomonas tetramitiformis TaxID=36881 RepID=A0AAE0GP76_9CHLO|nr:hypothetical protein CYMTET_10442 [Cymbomonas tetramitiformis]